MVKTRALSATSKLYIVAIFLVLQSLDIATTYVGLRRGAREANIVPAWLLENHGELAMYAIKALVVIAALLVVVALQHKMPSLWRAIRIANVMMILVVTLNLFAIL